MALSPADIQAQRNASTALLAGSAFTTSTSSGGTTTNSTVPSLGSVPSAPPSTTPQTQFTLLNAMTPTGLTTDPTSGKVASTKLSLGIEPNVHLDEKADYISHLHRIRRVNLGDDNSDSAGYGLYLMRVPVSIEPGDKTKKGFGAVVDVTMRHDFGPRFLPATYRNLVINDVVDELAPVIYELIRSGDAKSYNEALQLYLHPPKSAVADDDTPKVVQRSLAEAHTAAAVKMGPAAARTITTPKARTVNRRGPRTYAIAPSDMARVFVLQNLLNLAYSTQVALDLGSTPPDALSGKGPLPTKVNPSDVRSYLRSELESAYDLMEGRAREQTLPLLQDEQYIEDLTDQVYSRKYEGPKGMEVDSPHEFNAFYNLYESFANRLPGNLRFRPVGVLCWGIAIQSGS